MNTTRIARRTLVGASGVVLAALMLVATPEAKGQGVTVRAWVGAVGRYVLSDNEPFASPGFGNVELKVDGSVVGFGADVELRANKWFGLDGAVGYSKLNVLFSSSTVPSPAPKQTFGIVPLLLSLNVHVVHSSAVDIWVGPQIGYVVFPDTLFYPTTGAGAFNYKPKNVFSPEGFVAGMDIRLAKSVALNAAFRWQDADGDADGHLTIDPAFVTVGLSKKF